MKRYIIIVVLAIIAACIILIQDRTIVIESNIKNIEGHISISSTALNKLTQQPIKKNDLLKIGDIIEINISE